MPYYLPMQITCANETLRLLPERAVLWPRMRTLLVADAHFGKAAAFRAKGMPVPHGTTAANLALLAQLVQAHALQEVIFLGDFLHAAQAKAPRTLAALAQFRTQHAQLAMTLVRGNHDHHAGDPPASLNIQLADEPLLRGPFALCHVPQTIAGHYVLAGHIHPAVRISSRGQAARLPCFWLGAQSGVLPAFGEFTGMHCITPQAQDRVYAVAQDQVLQVPVHVLAA
jgi:uncharacterized protein